MPTPTTVSTTCPAGVDVINEPGLVHIEEGDGLVVMTFPLPGGKFGRLRLDPTELDAALDVVHERVVARAADEAKAAAADEPPPPPGAPVLPPHEPEAPVNPMDVPSDETPTPVIVPVPGPVPAEEAPAQ